MIRVSMFLFTFCIVQSPVFAQQIDTLKVGNFNEITIMGLQAPGGMDRMPDVKDNTIYTGKKSEVIRLDKINADLSTNNTRQVFAKVPGMSIWENDGSGIQAGVAARGLSPNRSWEFNVRQNGYDISSESFGYPEAYYTPPMEALEKIEVVRGSASLQFGPQFGGLLNYRIKKANPTQPISFETQQTVGSYGLFNTYNALGGNYKKFSFYGFLHHRAANGWRENSEYSIHTGYLSASFQVNEKIKIEGEYTKMNYTSQQPGGLTDEYFKQNPRTSQRDRNWFGAPFSVASVMFSYDITPNLRFHIKTFVTLAERNSVGFTKAININDTINASTLEYNARQVDRDYYKNYGAEMRMSANYTLFKQENTLAGGIRMYQGNTRRNQAGIGTTGHDFDLTLTQEAYGRALEFGTTNYAAFAENIFRIGKRVKIVPGVRFEYITNNSEGYINTTTEGKLPMNERKRQILLYGVGGEFALTRKTKVYSNYSLAYRPVTFSELTPSATTEVIDPNLKDASGFNADFGYRGSIKNYLNFDIGGFYLQYNDRIGTITLNNAPFKTNIGTSVSTGLESYIELDVIKMFNEQSKLGSFSVYASNALIQATYVKWENPSIANDPSKSIEDKRVENAPEYIHRFGATYTLNGFSITGQMSSVGEVFTDATNTTIANATGTNGLLEAYNVIDVALHFKFMEHYNLKAGVNNLSDEKYATRRAGGYPGPGMMPGNGRTYFVSFGGYF